MRYLRLTGLIIAIQPRQEEFDLLTGRSCWCRLQKGLGVFVYIYPFILS